MVSPESNGGVNCDIDFFDVHAYSGEDLSLLRTRFMLNRQALPIAEAAQRVLQKSYGRRYGTAAERGIIIEALFPDRDEYGDFEPEVLTIGHVALEPLVVKFDPTGVYKHVLYGEVTSERFSDDHEHMIRNYAEQPKPGEPIPINRQPNAPTINMLVGLAVDIEEVQSLGILQEADRGVELRIATVPSSVFEVDDPVFVREDIVQTLIKARPTFKDLPY